MADEPPTDVRVVTSTPGAIEHAVRDYNRSLANALNQVGLPSEGVLVPIEERVRLFSNLAPVVSLVDSNARQDALYLSKFVAASSIGLFDAALNYVWNETVKDLRRKVASFDLEYFAQSLKSADKTGLVLRSEDDLRQLEDWQLITGCRNAGIISEIAYKHLDYIRDMRNHASAAHPNQVEITGLQLAAWLEQCIREVLGKPPEASAVHNKALLTNLRTKKLSAADAGPIRIQVGALPVPYANALLLAVFGLYVDARTSGDTKANVELVAKAIWDRAAESARNEIGCVRFTQYSANGETEKKAQTKSFVEVVRGQAYLSEEAKALELQELVTNLWNAHMAMGNFYSEPAHARALLSLITSYNGALPKQMIPEYVRVVARCKMGNGHGICYRADPLYDSIINTFGPKEVVEFARLCSSDEFKDLFRADYFVQKYKEIAGAMITRSRDTSTSVLIGTIMRASDADLRSGKAWMTLESQLK